MKLTDISDIAPCASTCQVLELTMSNYQKLKTKSKDSAFDSLLRQVAGKIIVDACVFETDIGSNLLLATHKKSKKYWFCFGPDTSSQLSSEEEYNKLLNSKKVSKYKPILTPWQGSKFRKVTLTRERSAKDPIFHFVMKCNNEKLVYKVDLNRPAGKLIKKTSVETLKEDIMVYDLNNILC